VGVTNSVGKVFHRNFKPRCASGPNFDSVRANVKYSGVVPTGEECMNPETVTLSEWEQKVVDLVSVGLTDDEIATHLEVSKHTVLNCIALLLAKLGTEHRIEIVLYAYGDRANFVGTNNEATGVACR